MCNSLMFFKPSKYYYLNSCMNFTVISLFSFKFKSKYFKLVSYYNPSPKSFKVSLIFPRPLLCKSNDRCYKCYRFLRHSTIYFRLSLYYPMLFLYSIKFNCFKLCSFFKP